MTPPAPSFGKRGLRGPPLGRPPPPPRRMRSNVVAVGAVGLLALGLTGATAYQEYHCWPPKQGEPDERPQWCFTHSHSGGGGHGFFAGASGGSEHASFGGFGAHGAGHGGGE